jgi:hypothetical protein
MYRHPQDELFLPDPNDSPAMYGGHPEQNATTDEDDGESGDGVQVEVVEKPNNEYQVSTRTKAVATTTTTTTTATRGGQTKGRKRPRW